MKPWQAQVRPGDNLYSPKWNATERDSSQLPSPVSVIEVIPAQSQSGLLFAVRTNGGIVRNLDADWFDEPATNA